MTPESKQCDWCNRDIDDDVFKLYGGMRLHVQCYEEFVNEQFYNGDE